MRLDTTLLIAAAAGASLLAAAYGSIVATPDQGTPRPPAGATLAEFESFARQHAADAAAWKLLGRAYRRAGRTADAIDAYVRAARLAPQDRETNIALRELSAERP